LGRQVIARALDSKNNKIETQENFTTLSLKKIPIIKGVYLLLKYFKTKYVVTEIEVRSQIKDLFITARTYFGQDLEFSQIQLVDEYWKISI
jgi:hypothetical protein